MMKKCSDQQPNEDQKFIAMGQEKFNVSFLFNEEQYLQISFSQLQMGEIGVPGIKKKKKEYESIELTILLQEVPC